MIFCENEVCKFLGIPSIPKKKWDGNSGFKSGVGIVDLMSGNKAYVAVTFNPEKDKSCRVIKVFINEQFSNIDENSIFVVPDYMDTNVESMDFDETSKEAAQALVNEALDLENADDAASKVELPENEYYFPNITSDEEAIAFLTSYNKTNKIRGKVPTTHEAIVMRLSVIHSEINNKSNKSTTSKRKRK